MKVILQLILVSVFVLVFNFGFAQCTINGPGQVCASESVSFFSDQPIMEWSVNGMLVDDDGNQTLNYSFPNPFPTGSESFTISAVGEDGMTCTQTVTVFASPEISLTVVDEDEECNPDLSNVDFCLCEVEPEELELSLSTPFAAEVTNITIDWGDGTIEDVTANVNGTVAHTYTELGLFDIRVFAMGDFFASCLQQNYQVFHGTDPIASLEDDGNNPTGCNVMIPFEIDTNNIEGTIYQIYILEGPLSNFDPILIETFTQEDIVDNYNVDFAGYSSCQNGSEVPFWVNLVTINPCKRKEDVNGPYLISSPPTANFSSVPFGIICVGEVVFFTSESSGGFINGSSCDGDLTGMWAVSGSGTSILSGDMSTIDDIELLFEQPGTYVISLEAFNDDGGVNNCPSTIYTDTLTVLPNGEVSATTNLPSANQPVCTTPFTLSATETSDLDAGFIWTLTDDIGNEVATGDANNFEFVFTDDLAGSYMLELSNGTACNVLPFIIDFEIIATMPINVLQDTIDDCNDYTFNFDEVFQVFGNFTNATIEIDGVIYDYPDELADIPLIEAPSTGNIIFEVENDCGDTVTEIVPYTIESGEDITIDTNLNTNVCINDGGTIDLNNFITPNDNITWLSGNAPDGIFDISQANLGDNFIEFAYGCANNTETITIIADTEMILMDAVVCDDIIDITPIDFPYEGTCECNCAGIVDPIDCTFNPMLVTPGNSYEVTFTSNSANACGDNTAIAQITVEELTASLSTSTINACTGEVIDFEVAADSPDVEISWDFGDGSPPESGSSVSHNYDSPGAYEVIATISSTLSECVIPETVTVNITSTPELLYELNIEAECEGSLINATIINFVPNSIPTITYTMETSNGDSIALINGIGSIFLLGDIEATEYTVTLVAESECGSSGIGENITISPIFNANFDVINLDNNTNTFCGTDTISFGDISTGPIDSFVVYYDNWTNFSINEFEPQTYHNGSDNIEQHTVTLVLFSAECGTDTAEVIIDILPADVEALFNVNDSIFCFGDTLIVHNLSTPGSDSYFNINNGSSTMSFGIDDTISVDNLLSGNYIVSVIAEGCGIDTTQLGITVGDMLQPQIMHDLVECTGNPVTFTTDLMLNNMQWVTSDGQESNDIMPVFTFDTPGEYTIQLTGNSTDEAACEVVGESEITIIPMPDLALTVNELSICVGDTLIFEAITESEQVIWIFSNGVTLEGDTVSIIPEENGEFYAEVIAASADGRCQVEAMTDIVIVEGNFEIDAGEEVSIPLGASVELLATSSESVLFEWQPSGTLTCDECDNPVASPTEDTWYTVVGTNINGCTAVDSVLVRITDEINVFIPNVFSPNDDDVNDSFTVYVGTGVAQVTFLRVYDRWGELVFGADDPDEISVGWDGTHKGREMNIGTFVYHTEVQKLNGGTVAYSGSVHLVR